MSKIHDELEPEEIGQAIHAFMAPKCPFCDGAKERPKDAFCPPCLAKLPPEMCDKVQNETSFLDNYHHAYAILSSFRG